MPRKRIREPEALDLLFMLVDSCMHRLSSNAWKVVSYVASQHLRVHGEMLARQQDPAGFFLRQDFESLGILQVGILNASSETGVRPYRSVPNGPKLPSERGVRLPVISLRHLCDGTRVNRRWRDYGTGLIKSSVAEAIKEAIQSGILVREHHRSANGCDLASLYGIDWDRVQEYDWQRRKNRRKPVSRLRIPKSGGSIP